MGLPGISTEQMMEVDRIMVQELGVPVELMMEHAGLSLARFTIQKANTSSFLVIAGPGNNGGGGIVAARRLAAWGFDVQVFLPMGEKSLRVIPRRQLLRTKAFGADFFDGLPQESFDGIVLDAYLGYGFTQRDDAVSEDVFSYLRNSENVISLDVPSGFDTSTGKNIGGLIPSAVLTLAFVKKGLFLLPKEVQENVFVVDIGVPSFIYRTRLGIKYHFPFSLQSLEILENAFSSQSIVSVEMHARYSLEHSLWTPIFLGDEMRTNNY